MTSQGSSGFSQTPYRLLFYNDSKGFGGHEVASITLLQELLADGDFTVDIIIRDGNQRYAAQLGKLRDLKNPPSIHTHATPHIRFHNPYHLLNPGPLGELTRLFQQCRPHGVWVSQGNLEVSALGVLAARQAGLPCLSYIPMAHTAREMQLNYGRWRDCFNRFLVRKPTRWLTCSTQQADRLRKRGAVQPIDIIPNPIGPPRQGNRDTARRLLGIPDDALVIGMVGRLNNKQKGCDLLVQALKLSPPSSLLRKACLLFIGNGEDWQATRLALEMAGWAKRIFAISWVDEPESYYPAFDLIVMPSRYEGLPLVMQESLLCGVPVASTQVDGLEQQLPAHWCCPPDSPHALLHVMESFTTNPATYRSPLASLQQSIRTQHTPEAAAKVLRHALRQIAG